MSTERQETLKQAAEPPNGYYIYYRRLRDITRAGGNEDEDSQQH